MGDEELVGAIRGVIVQCWPDRFDASQIDSETPLGSEGLGLDSIEIVEVILECEQLLGRRCAAALHEGPPITIERIAESLRS